MRAVRRALLVLVLVLAGCGERGQEIADVGGRAITVYTYRPPCEPAGLLLLFHGSERQAEAYRDGARDLADKACLLVYAPLFDKQRFPPLDYHMGGLFERKRWRERANWTVQIAGGLIEWARRKPGNDDLPVYLFGHSAGGQFVSRVAAFADLPKVARIVVASAATHVMPSFSESVPFGLGRLPDINRRQLMQAYLGRPLTIYVGDQDLSRERLNTMKPAEQQGENRVERARFAYAAALGAAKRWRVPCNWRFVEAKGVGHSGVLSAPEAMAALGLDGK